MSYFAEYNPQKNEIIISLGGEDYHLMVTCTASFYIPEASIHKPVDGDAFVFNAWKRLDVDPRDRRQDLETHLFFTGSQLLALLETCGMENAVNLETIDKLSPTLSTSFQAARIKLNTAQNQ